MQAQRENSSPLLYSQSGFRYCDLLLAAPARAAWTGSQRVQVAQKEELVAACRAVAQRAAQTIEIANRNSWLVDIALDHLTLGRATLYEVLLSSGSTFSASTSHLTQAVSGLRRFGAQDFIVRGLLSLAWCSSGEALEHEPHGREQAAMECIERSQTDLDEAWDIASRGPMPLHMADIHLYRARLFREMRPYPWESPEHDLTEARRLIEKHGYWRRKEELEDAEAALRSS